MRPAQASTRRCPSASRSATSLRVHRSQLRRGPRCTSAAPRPRHRVSVPAGQASMASVKGMPSAAHSRNKASRGSWRMDSADTTGGTCPSCRRPDRRARPAGETQGLPRTAIPLFRVAFDDASRVTDQEGIGQLSRRNPGRRWASCAWSCAFGTRSACRPGFGPMQRAATFAGSGIPAAMTSSRIGWSIPVAAKIGGVEGFVPDGTVAAGGEGIHHRGRQVPGAGPHGNAIGAIFMAGALRLGRRVRRSGRPVSSGRPAPRAPVRLGTLGRGHQAAGRGQGWWESCSPRPWRRWRWRFRVSPRLSERARDKAP
jgi:hypothetical protein